MEEGEALAEEYNAKFFEVSAKLNENVNECYNAAASDIVVKLKENPDFYGSVGEQKVKSGSEAKEKPKDKLKELMELYDMFVSRFEKGGWEDLEDWALSVSGVVSLFSRCIICIIYVPFTKIYITFVFLDNRRCRTTLWSSYLNL